MQHLEELTVVWRSAILPPEYRPRGPLVEVHLVPAAPARHGTPELERIRDELAADFTRAGSSAGGAWAFSTAEDRGLAVLSTGQRTCWFPFEDDDLAVRVAARLTALLDIALPLPDSLATAIGLDPVAATTKVAGRSVSGSGRIRIGTEEALSPGELRRTSREIAEGLVTRLAAPLG
ncbi:hypothetical protein VA596_11840 [Amycolatopsis sp., V23-08]|uniref:Uncharacterized protein n=1 Tax=Amycolatopsis heterodermiae TaxID=3110235 RepID=A0ABU5R3J0_9PSEU|nr:hypothetical protein [Amycolatopsis sp., V23-08]MEA5360229.1 hypothetical protein [Amycolatopsis sp., V23-08]